MSLLVWVVWVLFPWWTNYLLITGWGETFSSREKQKRHIEWIECGAIFFLLMSHDAEGLVTLMIVVKRRWTEWGCRNIFHNQSIWCFDGSTVELSMNIRIENICLIKLDFRKHCFYKTFVVSDKSVNYILNLCFLYTVKGHDRVFGASVSSQINLTYIN